VKDAPVASPYCAGEGSSGPAPRTPGAIRGCGGASSFRILSLDETPSTNSEVKRALDAGEAEGLVVCARRQVAGYGRQGRAWTSPEGGLYCSLLLRPDVDAAILPTLSLVVGMAVRRAVASLVDAGAAERVKIKWPNDVVVAQNVLRETSVRDEAYSKLCGISLEAPGGGVCVGVGVNVVPPAERPDVGGKNRAAYVSDLMSSPVSIEDVLEAFLTAFAPLYDAWTSDGFAPLVDEFNAHASLLGRSVSVVDRSGATLSAGTVERVDAWGRLLLHDEAGAEIPVCSGEAHLV
jgi:BirA family transcriptional regulator, biotin operon repressor / biotin---[acetyl-CoA-carboxylase] ligase